MPALPQGQVDGGVRGLETKLPPRGDGVAEVVPACVLPLRERCPRRSSVDDQRLSPFLSFDGTGMYASVARKRIGPGRLSAHATRGEANPRVRCSRIRDRCGTRRSRFPGRDREGRPRASPIRRPRRHRSRGYLRFRCRRGPRGPSPRVGRCRKVEPSVPSDQARCAGRASRRMRPRAPERSWRATPRGNRRASHVMRRTRSRPARGRRRRRSRSSCAAADDGVAPLEPEHRSSRGEPPTRPRRRGP